MSNAFNLSQLANFVDTSGKLNVSTGSTGTLPTTQGGTGLTTVGTAGQVLQSNGTTLSYVTPSSGGVTSLNGQTGAVDNTTLYAIGSYTVGRPQNLTDYPPNSTIAGTSLYTTSHAATFYINENGSYASPFFSQAGAILINTGSWRSLSPSRANIGDYTAFGQGLWVRYA